MPFLPWKNDVVFRFNYANGYGQLDKSFHYLNYTILVPSLTVPMISLIVQMVCSDRTRLLSLLK